MFIYSNLIFHNSSFQIIGRVLTQNIYKLFKLNFKKIEWEEKDVDF